MFPSNMLLLNLILLIDVTFSTPTGAYTHRPDYWWHGDVTPIDKERLRSGGDPTFQPKV